MQLRTSIPSLLAAFLMCAAHGTALAATFAVNDTADRVDADPGDGSCATAGPVVCTLRAAVQEANALDGPDMITVPAGTFTLSLAGAGEDAAATGDLDVLTPVTITGNGAAGANATIVNGNDQDRIFDIFGTAGNVTISALAVTDGFSGAGQLAGGIWNSATLTLSNVRVLDSEGRLGGGGINNDGTLTATDVTIDGCRTNSQGAGLYNTASATLTAVTISRNQSAAAGGGIQNDDTVELTNVTLSNNTAVTDGGALYNGTSATLKNVTIAQNDAGRGGGIFSPGDLTVTNTIVSESSGGNCDIGGVLTSGGSNIDSGSTCGFAGAGDLSGVSAGLGLLGDYGGPTETIVLVAGSPALDAGVSCPPPATDQRGTARPQDGNGDTVAVCDIGAFESAGTPPASTTSTTTTGGSTTTTTIVGCDATPRAGCLTPGKGKLAIKERVAGREKLSIGLKRFPDALPQAQFGNPATGDTRLYVCLYDGAAQLIADLAVDKTGQSGETCGGTPPKLCWKALAGKGYRYADPNAADDGVRKILLKGGPAKKGKISVQAGNDDRKEQTALPVGIAAALQASEDVTVQIVTSDAACFGLTMTDIGTATATSFKASGTGTPSP